MSIYDWQPFAFLRPAPPPSSQAPPPPRRTPRGLGGQRARVSVDDVDSLPFFTPMAIEAPPDADTAWRTQNLDSKTLNRMSPARLLELMANLSPEISRALFDFVLMMNPGYEVEAYQIGSDEINEAGQAAIDKFIDMINELYVSIDVPIGRLILGGFLRGAFAAELVLDQTGCIPVDLATPDPWSIRFKKIKDPVRGQVWQQGQWQAGNWVPLDIPTVAYVPIHPLPGSPYGRSLVGPAIFTAIFLIGLMHDLRRVVAQQGYPRIDISVNLESLAASTPGDIMDDPQKWEEWVNAIIGEVQTVYTSLEPDDAYVHTSVVNVNRPVGTVDSSSLGAIDGLIMALERMLIRALKSVGILMIFNDSTTETHANRQWEIYAQGIKSMQHLLEALLQKLLKVALRAQGIQARVEWRFAELRASEMLRDAQVEALLIANAARKRDEGWISQDQASQEVTGAAADQPGPRAAGALPEAASTPIPEEGEARWAQFREVAELVEQMSQKLGEMSVWNGGGNGRK